MNVFTRIFFFVLGFQRCFFVLPYIFPHTFALSPLLFIFFACSLILSIFPINCLPASSSIIPYIFLALVLVANIFVFSSFIFLCLYPLWRIENIFQLFYFILLSVFRFYWNIYDNNKMWSIVFVCTLIVIYCQTDCIKMAINSIKAKITEKLRLKSTTCERIKRFIFFCMFVLYLLDSTVSKKM